MALARVKVWNPGDVLTASDLNGEFNNIINNPISLISPSTGAINFALQAHTNLVPSAISASSASAGQALIASGGATVWGTPTIQSSQITVAAGSTGQVLAVTSSNSAPAFQVIPTDGGLSTTLPTAGMTYFISTNGTTLLGRTIGSSGQVYTVSTSGVPVWATPAASGGGGGNITVSSSVAISITEEFYRITGTAASDALVAGASVITFPGAIPYFQTSGTALFNPLTSNPSGVVTLTAAGTIVSGVPSTDMSLYQTNPQFTVVYGPGTTDPLSLARAGLVGTTGTNAQLLGSTNVTSNDSVFFIISATSGGPQPVSALARVGGVETVMVTTLTLLASQGDFGRLQLNWTSSGTQCTVVTNGVTAGVFTSSQIPTSTMKYQIGFGTSGANRIRLDGWQLSVNRPTTFVI